MRCIVQTARPKDMSKAIVKHSMSEARDCTIEWKADFARMEILLYVSFISPVLLLDFLSGMARRDERFQKVGIVDALQISSRFNIKLCVAHGDDEIWYAIRVYKLRMLNEKFDRLEIEMSGITAK